jgi:hypothetical protein
MRAFTLHTSDGLWMAFGDDALTAANTLPKMVVENHWTEIGVGGVHDLNTPIDLYKLWPYFTNNPSRVKSPE